jgi:hypothetical protein
VLIAATVKTRTLMVIAYLTLASMSRDTLRQVHTYTTSNTGLAVNR